MLRLHCLSDLNFLRLAQSPQARDASPLHLGQVVDSVLSRQHRTVLQHALVNGVVAAVLRVRGPDFRIVGAQEHEHARHLREEFGKVLARQRALVVGNSFLAEELFDACLRPRGAAW